MWYSCNFTSKFLQSESRVFTRLAYSCSFLQDLDALASDGAWSPLSDWPVRLQKFPAIWLRIGGLLYLTELSDLNGIWFRWEGKYIIYIYIFFERFSLAGLHPQQGTTMAKRSKLVFVRWKKETNLFFFIKLLFPPYKQHTSRVHTSKVHTRYI